MDEIFDGWRNNGDVVFRQIQPAPKKNPFSSRFLCVSFLFYCFMFSWIALWNSLLRSTYGWFLLFLFVFVGLVCFVSESLTVTCLALSIIKIGKKNFRSGGKKFSKFSFIKRTVYKDCSRPLETNSLHFVKLFWRSTFWISLYLVILSFIFRSFRHLFFKVCSDIGWKWNTSEWGKWIKNGTNEKMF